jgi:hypothetical protein
MTDKTKTKDGTAMLRWSVIVAVAAIALFGSYRFAIARTGGAQSTTGAPATLAGVPVSGTALGAGPAATGGGGCACCGGSTTQGPAVTKQAEVAGNVQKITVDLSKGYYDPSTIELKAGVPAEITFGQSSGCTGQVQSADLGFSADLTQGPATVKLPALPAGTYRFACGMNMVSGTIVVK